MRRYSALLYLMALPILAYTAWQALRHRDARYLRERLGYFPADRTAGAFWVHAASVGEVNAVMPLLHALRARHPGLPLLLTVTTPTGGLVARRQLPPGARQHYLPVDWRGAVYRFLRGLRPACAVIMETELWPRLYAACQRQGIPLVIINGRLSPRTLSAGPWLRGLYAEALADVRAVLARADEDGRGFVALGAPPERVRVTGNIKFAAAGAGTMPPADLGRPYVLAASTHADEELRMVRVWGEADRGGRLLVIAPRHPQRLPAILRQLQPLGVRLAVRSRGEPIDPATEVYLADTFGELPAFIAGADLVFMGGSLVPLGGHNILEAARLGKAVLFGPHMQNFRDEAAALLAHGAAEQVDSDAALEAALSRLLADSEGRARMGRAGAALMAERVGVLERYLQALTELCPPLQPGAAS